MAVQPSNATTDQHRIQGSLLNIMYMRVADYKKAFNRVLPGWPTLILRPFPTARFCRKKIEPSVFSKTSFIFTSFQHKLVVISNFGGNG
jgi:hypothetical protein